MSTKQSHLTYVPIAEKRGNREESKEHKVVKNNDDRLNVISVFHNPLIVFLVSPVLAYKFFVDLMPSVLLSSTIFGLIIFSISFFFLLILLFGILMIMKNGSIFLYNICFHKRAIVE
ncbi:hypothetical protein A2334_00250 [Candidatus Roizmanbacteria bacterium RIFOXYB2_FULL_38_10]|uniref:Uncharacterized protein n=1 Tax=Candidatus Roizmanbacteria bacterium RIFOXYD1_FULL_38_12 TaxID=1802093 RepID=A0A1F7L299_9BACT|nr:MAG: hypothetical protein A3K47_05795 [Candidatus Roizmanbacteria bacterium RIFOXYA2_FULL_38_14]OGK64255.1 MAG: hypothetical protein A3K27_05795 [Candidatus Roizmanbacteria bacterium RIFOXYA1_FULL_37_12]OGK66101.1 MAG: hypothetical protein A3K38_05795 [Candidatus Roizmanbacteria bacterium RIFOXYB1_FULL_40_23]OGK67666.1 MAG: hypothetical protein A2334_00250 [Candidatus Roizmanbacteria bacterium RIFOXYB2_FULL_38_10]OGK70506.1 MAG: hypothetical protein A3K21_05800 [Candidatus Roizmanbacteria ba